VFDEADCRQSWLFFDVDYVLPAELAGPLAFTDLEANPLFTVQRPELAEREIAALVEATRRDVADRLACCGSDDRSHRELDPHLRDLRNTAGLIDCARQRSIADHASARHHGAQASKAGVLDAKPGASPARLRI
jgi:hypothetical protein